jgi:energy-converting hydrogenase Eha subunit H
MPFSQPPIANCCTPSPLGLLGLVHPPYALNACLPYGLICLMALWCEGTGATTAPTEGAREGALGHSR